MKPNFFALLSVLASVGAQDVSECGREGEIISASLLGSCAILRGSLAIHKASELNHLKEIKGELIIKASLSISQNINVHHLIIEDIEDSSMDLKQITAQALTIYMVKRTTLSFGTEPKNITLEDSDDLTIHGITGSQLKQLKLFSSGIPFKLSKTTSLEVLKINDAHLPDDFLGSLRHADNVAISRMTNELIQLPLETVTDITFSGNNKHARVNLPNLVTATGLIHLSQNDFSEFSALNLKSARMNLGSKIDKITIPKNMTWEGKSHFNSKGFCEEYASGFQELEFDTSYGCNLCNFTTFTVTPRNSHLIQGCEQLSGNLVINQSSPQNIDISSLNIITGNITLDSFSGSAKVESLKTINGTLTLRNCSIPEDLTRKLHDVSSLHLVEVKDDIKFSDLKVSNSIQVSNSSLVELSGLTPVTLETIAFYNCTNLKNFPLHSLKNITTISLSSLPVVDLKSHFSDSLIVKGDLILKNLNITNLDIGFTFFPGTLNLHDNLKLELVHLYSQDYIDAPVVNINNQKLKRIEFPELHLDYRLNRGHKIKAYTATSQATTHTSQIITHTQNSTATDHHGMSPNVDKSLRLYITLCLPAAIIASILLMLYLK